MLFDASQAEALAQELVNATAGVATHATCSASAAANPLACVGVGSGVVNPDHIAFCIWFLCPTWTQFADFILTLPTLAADVMNDFSDLALWGLAPAGAEVTQDMVNPDPVTIATTLVQGTVGAIGSATTDLLQQYACFPTPTGTEAEKPALYVTPGEYLVLTVSGLSPSSASTLDLSSLLSSLGDATYADSSAAPYEAAGAVSSCRGGVAMSTESLDSPLPNADVACVNKTSVPELEAEVLDDEGNEVPGESATYASSAAAAGCESISPIRLAPPSPGNSSTTTTSPTTTAPENSDLIDVSCISATRCSAVGWSCSTTGCGPNLGLGGNLPLVETWSGAAWTVDAPPLPSDADRGALMGVACTSATACTAVGNYTNSAGDYRPLAEAWNGVTWVVEPTPLPSGANKGAFLDVSCTTPTACTAVGDYTNSAGTQVTLAEVRFGTRWDVQSTPNASGAADSGLSSVSCTSPTACTAVGDYTNSAATQVALAETWNGANWQVEPTFLPSDALVEGQSSASCTADTNCSFLSSVACTGAKACKAVGTYVTTARTFATLAEAWNGTTWSVEPTPQPSGAGAGGASLWGVSCTSTTRCTAVGDYASSVGTQVTLAESWNGTNWRIESISNPFAATNYLNGVSCASTKACAAVGDSCTGASCHSGNPLFSALAELWNGTSWSTAES